MPTIFVSHATNDTAKGLAIQFKTLCEDGSDNLEVFLSSDWSSIVSGMPWLSAIEDALVTHTHFVALITRAEDASLPWVCYEVGYARGRCGLPKIFVFGGINDSDIPFPLAGLHWVKTSDTNRWVTELKAMGVANVGSKLEKFGALFQPTKPLYPR